MQCVGLVSGALMAPLQLSDRSRGEAGPAVAHAAGGRQRHFEHDGAVGRVAHRVFNQVAQGDGEGIEIAAHPHIVVFGQHQLQAPQGWLDLLAAAFIALRLLYIALYVADLAALRSAVWGLALLANIAILFAGYR